MSQIRILNGNPARLESILKELSHYVEMKSGDAIVDTEIEVSRAIFERLITEGYYTAYQVKETGESQGPVDEFDPLAWKTVMFGPVGGG